ncbi:TPA: 16S rRNA (cytosine(1402)-N(4))-methyltransferase [Candidatus Nomurabacteria bacterium]|nr:16S rRNA (cytosine(1402)-N(4))-methyltransferase [Candidatus Nomurabacteria bacterium]
MHLPVLLKESIDGLQIKKGGIYVDCTTNRGGHSIEIAKAVGEKGTLICIDLDNEALVEAREKLEKIKNKPEIHFFHSNFRHLASILENLKIENVDGVLADLGLSSEELDESGRGFSFRFDEPLKMTFDASEREDQTTAYEIINNWSEDTIADILYGFADETYSHRIAHRIIERRKEKPIATTHELVDIIASAVPAMYRHRKTHFATKTFQALRMAVNDEIGSINDLIDALPKVLNLNGRACIITFHSTEDRIVKQGLRAKSETLKMINKKAIVPGEEELKENPRSRSAQLRIVEKIC